MRQSGQPNLTHPGLRHDIARKLVADDWGVACAYWFGWIVQGVRASCIRIVDFLQRTIGVEALRKIAVAFELRRHSQELGGRSNVLRGFISCEEEQFVLQDWAAHGATVKVLSKWLLLFCKEVPRIECLLAVAFRGASVNIVRAGLRGNQHQSSATATIFGLVGVLYHPELGCRLDGRVNREHVPFDTRVAGIASINIESGHRLTTGDAEKRRLR